PEGCRRVSPALTRREQPSVKATRQHGFRGRSLLSSPSKLSRRGQKPTRTARASQLPSSRKAEQPVMRVERTRILFQITRIVAQDLMDNCDACSSHVRTLDSIV